MNHWTKVDLNITRLKFHKKFPGANELICTDSTHTEQSGRSIKREKLWNFKLSETKQRNKNKQKY